MDTNKLVITAYKLIGYYHSQVYLREILKNLDIVCLSEHQLYECEFNTMINRCADFQCLL